jgi:glutamyl-tRNA synthetase
VKTFSRFTSSRLLFRLSVVINGGMSSGRVTRLAPSPTGALHLGNARTFLVNWLMARQRGWKVLLRIEDLDGPRVKRGADRGLIEDLAWLGINWDEGPIYQSGRVQAYRQAVDALVESGAAYPCACSRREVELAASAPHAEDGAAVYPGTCRGRFADVAAARAASGREPAVRFRVPAAGSPMIEWSDRFRGPQRIDAARQLGDFVIAKADGTAAYQLAVVVDDAAMGVTDVVRGDDLLDSAPRQILLYQALGWQGKIPEYHHLPLVVGPDGRRLAKRHGDSRLSYYRRKGVPAGRVLSLLARWSGAADALDSGGVQLQRAGDLLERFQLEAVPMRRIVFTAEDDARLLGGGSS